MTHIRIYDIVTETYLLDYNLVKNIPDKILCQYKNIDSNLFNIVRGESYIICMENKLLENIKEKTSLEIYNKIIR